ncbi:histone-lysine N-methyltransferase PRDM9-like [Branchiostoma lanceolatum]|uniref:histone-lysine N-methyltransferase PRDM9-like n=1 Tax=Branchiostoma lanceolatum TaxID=7740 RepID=UPI003453A235
MASVSSASSSGSDDENNSKQAASSSSSNPFASMIDTDFDMSKVPETEDIRVEQYFSKEELAELSKIEMTRYRNMKRNYDVMRMLGLPGKKPYFMERNRRSLVQPKEPPTPPLTSSESEEDEEWTPELERKKNQPPKKPWFLLPPKKPRVSKPKPQTNGPHQKSKAKNKAVATVSKAPETMESGDDGAKIFLGFQAEEVAEVQAATAASIAELEKKMKDLELEIQQEEAAGPQDGQEEGSESDISTDLEEELLTTTLQPAKQPELKKEPVEDTGESQKSRYPQRNIPRKNYKEVELPDDDHYLFCEDCNELYEGDCPVHGPLTVVKDKEVPKGEENRAVRTLPDFLSVCPSKIKGAGDGVWLDGKAMPKSLVFGPYDGKISGPEIGMTSGYAWQISKNDKVKYYIDATDVTKSSWMRYVNCARNEEEQNLVAFQYYRNIYYRTYKPVPPGTELLVWYGNEYAKELGISEKAETKGEEPNKQSFQTGAAVSKQVQLQATGAAGMAAYQRLVKANAVARQEPVQTTGVTGVVSSFDSLDRHVKTHTDMYEQSPGIQTGAVTGYRCSMCGNLFSTQDYLDRHVKKHGDRSGVKRHRCKHCNYSTDNSANLQSHMVTHTGERPHKCPTCGKGFTEKGNLKRHQLVHTDEKPYRCEECGRSFNRQGNLTRHMLTHSGQQPHVCTQCGKGCTRTGDLQKHMRIHTGEKPYKCEYCDRRFTQRNNLKTHVISNHTEEFPHRCQVCSKGFMAPVPMCSNVH